ncbi:MAG: class I SAM-dependent methyltransferase, partial [Acidobacteriota bacterium]|nr:class I SAM-dependent methyltransferase [Acidobacteriota bacterium]
LEMLPPSPRLLVLGSGTGTECVSLASGGCEVVGVDFSQAMVRTRRRRLASSFSRDFAGGFAPGA